MTTVKTDISKEIKKEYLLQHLDEVKEIIEVWINELHSPEPFASKGQNWGWYNAYKPSIEQNDDKNHILRYHIKSRTLWNHHSIWERHLQDTWRYVLELRQEARKLHDEPANDKNEENQNTWDYTEEYIETAVWTAFKVKQGIVEIPYFEYKAPDVGTGLYYGSYLIETTADSQEDRALAEQYHRTFVTQLQETEVMINLVEQITLVEETEKKMIALAEKHLKATDILHPCKFCRHLWK